MRISTKANNTNYMTYLFWHEQGRPVPSCPHAKQVIDVRLSATPEARDILRAGNP